EHQQNREQGGPDRGERAGAGAARKHDPEGTIALLAGLVPRVGRRHFSDTGRRVNCDRGLPPATRAGAVGGGPDGAVRVMEAAGLEGRDGSVGTEPRNRNNDAPAKIQRDVAGPKRGCLYKRHERLRVLQNTPFRQ
ncbi:hypothetical protein THAOC_11769, partial [Thalassiosira oceanica]